MSFLKLLFVCKRHPQQRDLVERPYGRFYYLPQALSELGHKVRVQLCGYRRLDSVCFERNGISWSSHDFLTVGAGRVLDAVSTEVRMFQPDWIIGCSDAWAGWLAHRLSCKVGCRLAIDAYDNFEAYMPANLPLHWMWRRAVRAADVVTAAGPQLADKLQRSRRHGNDVKIIPMTSDPNFTPMDRKLCRKALGLPSDAPLFGYSGGWTRSRGTNLILDAFRILRGHLPSAHLVLSGQPPKHALSEPGVISLGYLDDAEMPQMINAMDLCCVILSDTAFGRYSYPAKLCEAMSCKVPVVVSATGAASWMLDHDTRFLARVGDAEDHARLMLANYRMREPKYVLPPSWQDSAEFLSGLLASH